MYLFYWYNRSFFILEVRHLHPYRRIDVSRITHRIFFLVKHIIISLFLLREAHSAGKVTRIIDEHTVKSKEVSDQSGEENGAVFAIAIGIVKGFFGEESTVTPPYHLVIFIFEAGLDKIEQAADCLMFTQSLQIRAKFRVSLLFTSSFIGVSA